MSRFVSDEMDVEVTPDTGERFVLKAPDLDAFAEVLEILDPVFKKRHARLLDYDGRKHVLLISLDAKGHEVLDELPDDIVVKVAER